MPGLHLEVLIAEQKARLWRDRSLLWESCCSTSRFGTGCGTGTYQTPLGLFHLAEKIGQDSPIGTVFKGRVPTGAIWTPAQITDEDLVLTRILWLAGDEAHNVEDLVLTRILWLAGDEAHNVNTKNRYIYFHGTNHEALLGTPASHGCIRLSNTDILTIFDLVEVGTPVQIS